MALNPQQLQKTRQIKKQRIGRKYMLLEKLGKGAYGYVYLGYNVRSKQRVALKLIKRTVEWSRQTMEDIKREAIMLTKVSHANLAGILSFNVNCKWTDEDEELCEGAMFAMRLAQNGNLFRLVTELLPIHLPESIVKVWSFQLWSGLQALHDARIIHRDIKPQNLLLNNKFSLKITDFGLSRIEDKAHVSFEGTPGFRAPEILQRGQCTAAVDIFACGIIMFILRNGIIPFRQASKEDSFYRKIMEKDYDAFWAKHRQALTPESYEGTYPQCSAELKDLISKCLVYQPKDRIRMRDILTENHEGKHSFLQGEMLSQRELYDTVNELRMDRMNAQQEQTKGNPQRVNQFEPTQELSATELEPKCVDGDIIPPFGSYTILNSVTPRTIYNYIVFCFNAEGILIDSNEDECSVEGSKCFADVPGGSQIPVPLNVQIVTKNGLNVLILKGFDEFATSHPNLWNKWFQETIYNELVHYLESPYVEQPDFDALSDSENEEEFIGTDEENLTMENYQWFTELEDDIQYMLVNLEADSFITVDTDLLEDLSTDYGITEDNFFEIPTIMALMEENEDDSMDATQTISTFSPPILSTPRNVLPEYSQATMD